MQKKDIYKYFINSCNKLTFLSFIILTLTISNCGKKSEPLRPVETEKEMKIIEK
tara:strand:- start:275 stop:436 length:162 start_codon:yes stop_codon:yes gene_type:complete